MLGGSAAPSDLYCSILPFSLLSCLSSCQRRDCSCVEAVRSGALAPRSLYGHDDDSCGEKTIEQLD